jgi:hypothetical protein
VARLRTLIALLGTLRSALPTLRALLRTSRTRLGTLRTTLRGLQRLTVLSVGLKVIAVFELLPAPLTYKPIRILSHISPFMLLGTDKCHATWH